MKYQECSLTIKFYSYVNVLLLLGRYYLRHKTRQKLFLKDNYFIFTLFSACFFLQYSQVIIRISFQVVIKLWQSNNLFPLRAAMDTAGVFGMTNDKYSSDAPQCTLGLLAWKHHTICVQIAPQPLFSSQGEFHPSINFASNYEHSSAGGSKEV